MSVIHALTVDRENMNGDVPSQMVNAGYLEPHAGIAQFRVGSVTTTVLDTAVTVIFDTPLPDANYQVFLQPDSNVAVVVYPSNLTTTGFRFNLSVGVNATFGYLAIGVP